MNSYEQALAELLLKLAEEPPIMEFDSTEKLMLWLEEA